ncbi:MAG: PA14 domain-containing protein [Bryobacteraceae bacterium]
MRSWFSLILLLAFLWPPPAHGIKRRKDAFVDFGSPNCFPGMIRGAIYYLAPGTQQLPILEGMTPVGTVCAYTLDVPTRLWTQGMPGVLDRLEWFAIDYHADFWVEESGWYHFSLDSDDGSLLYIDGRLIVDDDGIHMTEHAAGRAKLTAGAHHLRVGYYQGPRDAVALVLNVAPPHGKWKLFDIRDYRMPMKAPGPTTADDEQRPILRRAESAHDPLAQKLYERPAMEALQANPPPHAFDFHLSALRFRPGPAGSQYSIAVEVPGTGIKITPGTDQSHRLHIVVLALIRDAEGHVVEKMSQDFPFQVPDARVAGFQAGSFSYTRPVTLPPGRYTLEAAIADREADHASVRAVQFENPEYGGVGLSDLLLVKKLEDVNGPPDATDPLECGGKRALPELAGVVRASAQPFIYFMVYPDAALDAKPRMEVELSAGGRVVARQTADLPAPNADGAIPMSVATVTAPGTYAVKIAIQQGSQRVERRLEYLVTAQ